MIDPHYYRKEDTVSPVETGPKAHCPLTLRLRAPLNGDEEILNEEGSKPHDNATDESRKHNTELSTMTLYHENFSYSLSEHGGRKNCKTTDPHS